MNFRSLGLLAGALFALVFAQPVAAQTLNGLATKDAASATQNLCVYNDGVRLFPCHLTYGWTGSAAKALAVDPTTGALAIQDAGGSLTVDTGTPGTFSVGVTSSVLPAGAATSALQTTANTTLQSILSTGIPITSQPLPSGAATATGVAAVVTALGTPLQAGGNVAVTASALPTGAATAAKQDALVTALGTPLQTGGSVGITGAANIATGQITATTTSGVLVAARTGRRTLTLVNSSTTPVYVGATGVTTSTGFLLPGVSGASLTLTFAGALYGVTSSGSAALAEYELY